MKMSSPEKNFHLECSVQVLPFFLLLCSPSSSLALSRDGILLLSFKYSVLGDPSSALADWNYNNETPCSWNGVVCMGFPATGGKNGSSSSWRTNSTTTVSRVTSLVLPGARLLGSIPGDVGLIEHLRHLDLSGNILNGTLPPALFDASELRVLSLADNEISGELPETVGKLRNLQVLNLSDNALMGFVPRNLTLLANLTSVSLGNNYLSGELPGGGFKKLEVLDLGSNLVNGSLPADLAGENIRHLNLSYNRFTGEIPKDFGTRIAANATVDLSFNNLTGEIPHSEAFLSQKAAAFAGNQDLCGKPLKNLCMIPSTFSNPPNDSRTALKSPPAFAAIPETPEGVSPPAASAVDVGASPSSAGLKPATIVAVTIGDLAGVGLLFMVFLSVYHFKKKKQHQQQQQQQQQQQSEMEAMGAKKIESGRSSERSPPASLSCCLRQKSGDGDSHGEGETSDSPGSSETETEEEGKGNGGKEIAGGKWEAQQNHQGGILVPVDGETKLELETLLKASAYILGATGATIVYKAVLADGTSFAVRRIGDSSSIDKLKDFEAQVRAIAKLRHPNVLPLRGFYWGANEKLLIHDYASIGNLANMTFSKKLGSSPSHFSWDSRLRIARGVARGLVYLHEKKTVHGNLKPSNILLSAHMEPMIGDVGIDRLLGGVAAGTKPGTSARQFGSKRSTLSQGSLPDLSAIAGGSPIATMAIGGAAAPPPYQAPESLKNIKPNPKWDVFSFGMVLLELMAGRVFLEVELIQWNAGFVVEEKNRVLRMADPTIRGEVEGKEEAMLSCFKLGFACAAMNPQRRPFMKDALQLLERICFASASSS